MSSENKFNLWGWFLFLVCAVLFVTAAARSGDILYLIGSVIFFVACLVFVIPILLERIGRGDN
ncbi:MAG: cytochrome oxidase subunit III [Dehalococcoidia bacterium]|nr:MAG: cytochrome oxidase subunit III [Dehalococcoidia bacterium]